MMTKNLINEKLALCFEAIKSNILSNFSGFIELNNNGLLNELENDISLVNEIGRKKISNIVNSQFIEIFDMIFCELYFENEKDNYLNGALKGKILIPLSQITKFSKLYQAENNYEINLLEVNKLTLWVLSESIENTNKLDFIYISDRLDDGDVEYVSYEINFKSS